MYLFLLLLVATFFAETSGRAKAETQSEFFVFAEDPDVAVVRIYKDSIIAVSIDRKTKSIKPQIVLKKSGNETIKLSNQANVGPLRKQVSWGSQGVLEQKPAVKTQS